MEASIICEGYYMPIAKLKKTSWKNHFRRDNGVILHTLKRSRLWKKPFGDIIITNTFSSLFLGYVQKL